MPKVGFREYWYPCVWSKEVGRKPRNIKMLGEELVLFRGRKGNVVALNEWCPHRGARLSRGFCEFEGTVTCPYHGYTFDETGKCVAGLIESTDSPLVGKMRTRVYPTAEWNDIVLVWMGETDPVPFEEDLPYEFSDSTLTGRKYTRVKMWETNWTEPMNQGIDYHEFYLHRGLNFWRFVDWRFPFWRPKSVSTGGTEIVSEGEDNIWVKTAEAKFGHAEYPGLGKWPRKTWWRKLPAPKTPNAGMIATATGEKAWATYNHNLQLPTKIRVCIGSLVHLRWGVPVDEENTTGLDLHHLQDSQDHLRQAVDGCLVLLLEQARPGHSHQRKGRPDRLQERAHQPGAAPEARVAGQGIDTLPSEPGQAFPGLPASRRGQRLPKAGARPGDGPAVGS